MNHLLRSHAPISEAAWAEIDQEAARMLRHVLAARKLVDFEGPLGWAASSVSTGRTERVAGDEGEGVQLALRVVQPLVEVRTPFTLSRRELESIDRGACDADLDPVVDAARRAATAEDRAVFHGLAGAGITGLTEATPHDPIAINDQYDQYPSFVARGIARLKDAGVGGPYAIALGPRCYTGVVEQSEMGGYPVLDHLRLILGGPVVWAPAVSGAVIVSQRGGDVELVCGQDFSIGYSAHDAAEVELYVEESFTVRLCAPEAAIHLAYDD